MNKPLTAGQKNLLESLRTNGSIEYLMGARAGQRYANAPKGVTISNLRVLVDAGLVDCVNLGHGGGGNILWTAR